MMQHGNMVQCDVCRKKQFIETEYDHEIPQSWCEFRDPYELGIRERTVNMCEECTKKYKEILAIFFYNTGNVQIVK